MLKVADIRMSLKLNPSASLLSKCLMTTREKSMSRSLSCTIFNVSWNTCETTFIHYDVCAPLKWVGVVDQSLQEDACGHERDLSHSLGPATLHAHLIADSLTQSLSKLLGDPNKINFNYTNLLEMLIAAILLGWVQMILQSCFSKSAFSSRYLGT